jgi:colanic acid biosynthesis glycosyl transferase WcaI
MANKFFLISQVFYPDEVSTANLFTNLCSTIAEDNFEVEVWSAQPSYSVLKRQSKIAYYKGIKIQYLLSTNFRKESIPGRFLNTITFILSVTIKLLLSGEKTTVFTHTTQPPIGIIVSLICKLRRRKFIYILLDIFPEGLIRLDKISKRNPLARLWSRMFIVSLGKSENIIVIGRDMKDWLKEVYPECHKKVIYIPLWQDEKLVYPSDFIENEFVIKYQLQNKFVVQYSGNMGLWNDMNTLAKAVQRNLESVMFMFVGGGIRREELLASLSGSDQKNVLFLSFQPVEKLGSLLTACHAGIVSMREGLEGMAVPSKIYGIMASGVPVIAMVPKNSEIAYIVKEENCGYVLNPTDLNGLVNAINELKLNENRRIEMGKNGRHAFLNKYSTRIIAQKYEALIASFDEFDHN